MVSKKVAPSKIEIEINATDNATEVVEKASGAFEDYKNKLEKGTDVISEVDGATQGLNKTMSMLGNVANFAKNNLDKLFGFLSSGIEKTLSITASLTQIIQFMQEVLVSEPSQNIFTAILKQGEEAISELAPLTDILGDLGSQVPSLLEGIFDTSEGYFDKTLEFLQKLPEGLNFAETSLRRFGNFFQKSFNDTGKFLEGFGKAFGKDGLGLADSIDVEETYGEIKKVYGQATEGITALVNELTYFEQGLQAITSIAQTGAFKLLIGQTVELREQLLATQSSLAGTSKILNFGEEITDPTQAIKSLEEPVNRAIARMKVESLDLVGVTSKELVPVFTLVAQNITAIGADLNDAKDLTLDFAASLGTLGIPLYQAEQEIDSILNGQIDINSALAQNLKLTNEQINKWKGEGTLIENLRKRLEAFRAGNALAAESFSGVTSNIVEVFDLIGQKAGEQLIDPLVSQLTNVYEYLNKNFDNLVSEAEKISAALEKVLTSVSSTLGTIFKSSEGFLATIPLYLFESFAHVVEQLGNGIQAAVKILQPFINSLTALAQTVGPLGSKLFQVGFALVALGKGSQILAGLFQRVAIRMDVAGDVMDVLEARSGALGNQFSNLSGIVGKGGAGFLLLGKNLEKFPPLMDALNEKLGPLGGFITPMIPQIATLGIQLGGLVTIFPPLGAAILGATAVLPKFLDLLANSLNNAKLFGVDLKPVFEPLVPSIQKAASATQSFSDSQDKANLINQLFTKGLRIAGREIAKFAIKTAVIVGGFYLAFKAIDEFILKNEELIETIQNILQGIGLTFSVILNKWTVGFVGVSAACYGLVLAIQGSLIPAIIKLIGTQLVGFLTTVAGATTFLSGALGAVGFTGLATKATALATSLTTLGAVMTGTGAAATGLAVALKGVALSAAVLLGPILAVGAALAAVGMLAYTQATKESSKATEEFGKQTDAISDSAIELATKLKAAKDKQQEADAKGIALTKEEYAENKRLASQAKLRIGLINDQIKALEEQKENAIGKQNKENLDIQIAQLERMKILVEDLSTNITIQPKDLPELGTTLEQLQKKADQAWEAILRPSGDPAIFKQKAEEVIEFNQALLDMGKVVDEDVIPKLRELSQDTRLDYTAQQKAVETIIKIIEGEAQEEIDIVSRKKAEVEALNAQQLISDGEKQRQLTELTLEELNIRKQALLDQYSEYTQAGNEEEAEATGNKIIQVEAEITEAIGNELQRRNEELIKKFQKRVDIIEGQLAQGFKSEEQYNEASRTLQLEELDEQERQLRERLKKQKGGDESILAELGKLHVERQKIIAEGYQTELDLLDRTLEESLDKVREAEVNRQKARLQAYLENGGDIDQLEADAIADNLLTQRAEYEKNQKLLTQLQSQNPLSDPRLEAERQEQIRNLRLETSQQALDIVNTEQEAWEQATTQQINTLDRQNNAALTGLQAQVNSGERLAETLNTVNAIADLSKLEAQLEREKDITKQAELQLQIEEAKASIKDAEISQVLAELELAKNENLIQSIQDLEEGIILSSEAQHTRALQTIQDLETQLALETDISKISALQLQLTEAQVAAKDAEEAIVLQKQELEQLKDLDEVTTELNAGKILSGQLSLFQLDQTIDRLKQQIELEDDQVELAKLNLQLTKATEDREEAANALKLQEKELEQSKELQQITQQLNQGRILDGVLRVKQLDQTIDRLETEIELEDDLVKIEALRLQLIEAREQREDANKVLKLQQIELSQTRELVTLTEKLNSGRILGEAFNVAQLDQTIARLQRQLALEDDLLEIEKIRLQLAEARESREQAQKALTLKNLEIQQNTQLLEVIEQVNAGQILSGELSITEADNAIARLRTQIQLTEDLGERKALQVELEQALEDREDAAKQLAAQKSELATTERLIELTREYNEGNILSAELEIATQEERVKSLEQQIELEDDLLERKKLILELEETREALEEARVQKQLRLIELQNRKELISLKRALYSGLKTKEQVEAAKAEATVKRIQAELAAEDDIEKKLALQEQLVDAINDKFRAQLDLYAAGLNKEVEKYALYIKDANRELERQARTVGQIKDAISQQQQLFDAQVNVFNAANDYYIGELEALKSTTRSKRKQAEIDQTIASLKLEAATKQIEYERISLSIKQQMLKFEQQRAVLQQQIALNEAKAEQRRATANAKIIASDPTKTREEKLAANQQARFASENVGFAEQSLALTQGQAALQDTLFAKELEAFEYRAKGKQRSAQVSAVSSIRNRGKRRQGLNAINQDIAKGFGYDNVNDLNQAGLKRSDDILRSQGLLNGTSGGLSPEEQLRSLRGESDTSGATLSAQSELYRITGGATQGSGRGGSLKGVEGLKLPGVDEFKIGFSESLQPVLNPLGSIKTILEGIKPSLESVKGNTTVSPNINIKIEAKGGAGEAIKKDATPQIKNIVTELVNLSR